MAAPDPEAPELYINRELSLLAFNERVLELAHDVAVPLLERLRFLCISSNNLDEFFEIRVAGLKQRLELGAPRAGPGDLLIPELLAAIHARAGALVARQYQCLDEVLLPALAATGLRLVPQDAWDEGLRNWLERYFRREIEPVLSPLGLDPARPFPRIQNKSLNFLVRLEGRDAFGRDSELAVVQAPRSLPRVVPLLDGGGSRSFVLLSAIVQ